MDVGAAQAVLMYFVLSLWLAAGFADYLCHRASSIETTSGGKESLLHLLQFGEMAIPVLAAIFLEINALVMIIMIVCLNLHEATAIGMSATLTAGAKSPPPNSTCTAFWRCFLLWGLLIVATLHWQQFLSLFGLGSEMSDFGVRLKQPPLPWLYVTTILSVVLLFEVLPYLEELFRGLRQETTRHER